MDLPVCPKLGDVRVPGFRVRWGGGLRPIVVRPDALGVVGVAAEVEDVELGEAQVFEELPGRKGQAFGLLPAPLGRNAVDGLVEADVGALPGEQLHQVIAEDRVGVHGGDGSAYEGGFVLKRAKLSKQRGGSAGDIQDAGEAASKRFIEFFTANIRNPNTRKAYGILKGV